MAVTPVYNCPLPLDPDDYVTPQAAAAEALGDDAPSQFIPYPTGSPPSVEDEIKRAAGIPLEEQLKAP